MKLQRRHRWDLTPKEAIALQKELAAEVQTDVPLSECELIAGADASYNRFSPDFFAAVVVMRADDCTVVETQTAAGKSSFPYVPGLLSFREAPILLEAFAKLKTVPDAVMIDGQGFAHPRRFGIASHIGLWLQRPCIGCAKTRLIGEFDEPSLNKGDRSLLKDGDAVIGHVVRTKNKVKPLFISVGHMIDLESATRWVLAMSRGYRMPEPTRQAHLRVNELRREHGG